MVVVVVVVVGLVVLALVAAAVISKKYELNEESHYVQSIGPCPCPWGQNRTANLQIVPS